MTRTGMLLVLAVFLQGGCDEQPQHQKSRRSPVPRAAPAHVEPEKESTGEAAPAPSRKVDRIRRPARSGQWYPAEADDLRRMVDSLLGQASPPSLKGDVVGLLAPHAGFVFSGGVAAHAFKTLAARKYDVILLLGPPHHERVPAASIGLYDAYETPLGAVPVDVGTALELLERNDGLFRFIDSAHALEHSLESELPFLQRVLPRTPILPILIGAHDSETHTHIAAALHSALKDKDFLVVISSDLSHFPDYEAATKSDKAFLRTVAGLDPLAVRRAAGELERKYLRNNLQTAACGLNAVLTALHLFHMCGVDDASVLCYANSGDSPRYGDKRRVVGYGAIAFTRKASREEGGEVTEKPDGLSLQAKKELLKIAREAVTAAVKHLPAPTEKSKSPELQMKAGCFVTIKNRGQLRGCLGCFQSDRALWQEVRHMARQSATQDPRFWHDRVTPDELPEIDIEISVLFPLERIEDPLDFEIGKHGLYVKRGGRTGTYLPQVAIEHNMSKEEFITHLCQYKAGIGADAWRQPDTEVYRYAAEVFSEKDLE